MKIIDIHAHLIPNVDDGSSSMEKSIDLINQEIAAGVSTIICTPHYNNKFSKSSDDIILKFNELQAEVKKRNIPIKLLLGQEILYSSKIYNMLDEKKILSLNNTKYILIEFSLTEEPEDLLEIIYTAKIRGYIPIIAHIERYEYLYDIDYIKAIKQEGALIQVNSYPLIRSKNKKQKNLIDKLIKLQLIDFIASDIHESRPNYLNKAYEYLSKKTNPEYVNKILYENFNIIVK